MSPLKKEKSGKRTHKTCNFVNNSIYIMNEQNIYLKEKWQNITKSEDRNEHTDP